MKSIIMKDQPTKIMFFASKGVREAAESDIADLLDSDEGVLWVDMTGPTEENVKLMQEVFKFHPLAIEDTHNQEQRPKAETYADHLFLILAPIEQDHKGSFRELDLFVGRNYVVTVHPGQEPVIEQAAKRLDPTRVFTPVSVSHLVYVLMDVVVDDYFPALDYVEEEIEKLSTSALTRANREILGQLFQLKYTLSEIWRVVRPQQTVINVLMNHEIVFIDENTRYHLRDVSDHLSQILDMVNTFRDMLNSLANIYMSAISNRLNRVVTRLTVITIIIGALTVIAGFYGMNFEHTWPPFGEHWSIILVIVMMISVVGVTLAAFRRRGWF